MTEAQPESKESLRAFQARWLRPAGFFAIVGAGLIAASGIVGRVGSADTDAEQLVRYHDNASDLLIASIMTGVGLAMFVVPLYVLFRAASGRAERMSSYILPLVILGPLLVGIQGVVYSVGLKDASDRYLAGVGAVEAKARQQAEPSKPATPAKGATTTRSATTTRAATTTTSRSPEQRVSDAKDDFANDRIDNSGGVKIARVMGLFAALALIAGGAYTLIWAVRTGLLTRFSGYVGIGFIAALLLAPGIGPIGLVLWFAFLGLSFAGLWPKPLPPAWDAGEAVPWPRPGEDLGPRGGPGPGGTVEGSGREVAEAPLPEDAPGGGSGQLPPGSEGQGERRKKRKRRS